MVSLVDYRSELRSFCFMYGNFHSLVKTSIFFIYVILESPQRLASIQMLSSMRWGSHVIRIFFFCSDYSHSVNITNSIQISLSRQFTTIKSNLCLFVWLVFFKTLSIIHIISPLILAMYLSHAAK